MKRVNPKIKQGDFRSRRGGGWVLTVKYCRSADRDWSDPANRWCDYTGFRLSLKRKHEKTKESIHPNG